MGDLYLDPGMQNWIRATARANLWRVHRWYRLEDLIQDGYMCFARCRARYPQFNTRRPTRSQRRHFMALVKVTFTRHIHSLSKRRFRMSDILAEDDMSFSWSGALGVDEPVAPLMSLLSNAPAELKELFVVLATDTTSYLKIGKRRETTNEHIGRILGSSPEVEYRGLLVDFIRE